MTTGERAGGSAAETGSDGAGPAEDRIITVPNAITVVRLACLPLFVWLLLGLEDRLLAGALLGLLGATDWVDGYIARRWHQVSTVGKILDPVADRLLFLVSIVAIVIADVAPLWVCVAVLAREIVVAVATLVLASLGARRIDVTWFGKAGTFSLMFAFPAFVWGSADWSLAGMFEFLGWGFALAGLALSYWAAVLYVPLGLRALREGRAERTAA